MEWVCCRGREGTGEGDALILNCWISSEVSAVDWKMTDIVDYEAGCMRKGSAMQGLLISCHAPLCITKVMSVVQVFRLIVLGSALMPVRQPP